MPVIQTFTTLFKTLFPSVFLLVVFSLSLSAQADPSIWKLESINVADQLGSNTVRSIVEDHQGYLWLATNTGIARYDGYSFKNYPSISGDSTSLNDSRPGFAFVDHLGNLWVGTRLGINRYLPECDCFKQYNAGSAAPNTVPDGGVNWIIEDEHKQMWLAGQYGGLYRYDRTKDQFERFLYRPEDPIDLSGEQLQVLLSDRSGNLWIGTGETSVSTYKGGGLIRYHPKTGKVKRYLHDPVNPFSLTDNRISALMQDDRGRIWVGTCSNGLHQYDPVEDRFIRILPGESEASPIYPMAGGNGPWTSCPHIRIIHEDQQGGIWVGTYTGGLYRFDPSGAKPRLFQHSPEDPQGLTNNLFWAFLEDAHGRFWLGNIIGGLYKIDPWATKFRNQFPGKVISNIFESPSEPGSLWVAAWDEGVYKLNRHTGESRFFQGSMRTSEGPASNRIKVIYEDSKQKLWMGHDRGLSIYDRESSQFSHLPVKTTSSSAQESASIYAIHEDDTGDLWLGSWGNGLYRFDRESGTFQQYLLPELGDQENNKFNQSIYAIHEGRQGQLWIGTWMEGFYSFDRHTQQFTRQLEGVGIRTIFEQASGNLWLGTGDHGLLEFAPEDGLLRSFTTKDSLPGNKVYAILEDSKQHLWLSTNAGISQFNPNNKTITNYGKADGLPALQFMDFSVTEASDGTFYFGSNQGLVSFRPDQVTKNPALPKIHIQDIKVFDHSYRNGEVDTSGDFSPQLPDHLILSHNQNELTFEYVGLHYTTPHRNQYRHRLLPYENQWIAAGTKRSARYTNLSPGHYQFEVISSNSDGIWAQEPAVVKIRIKPPWWSTSWAYLWYVIIVTSVLYSIYRFQKQRWDLRTSLQKEQEEAKRLQELDEFKNQFYTNITHEFRTPLTIIQGLADQIGENPRWKIQEKAGLIRNNSQQLLQLINQMLDLSKIQAGKLEAQYVQGNIIKYLSYLVESFHSLALHQNKTLSFHTTVKSMMMDYDPDKCRQIIGNLISNAIKFTPEYGSIKVAARILKGKHGAQQLEIEVKDTGIGISPEKLPYIFDRFYQVDHTSTPKANGSGLGLSLTKELLNLMDGSIQVQSEVGKGSTFTCRLPVRLEAGTTRLETLPQPIAPTEEKVPASTKTIVSKNGNHTKLPVVLIVEDNQDVIYYLRDCLDGRYRILEAKNGREGLQKAFEQVPDLVISDVMMPEMDGFELCRTLKTDERSSHIPVILLTAKVSQADKMEGLSQGADVYLAKPFQKDELLLRLDNLLELRHQMQQKFHEVSRSSQKVEDPFLHKTRQFIEEHLDDPDFGVIPLSRSLGMSRVQVHRKLKALTGIPTSQYIREFRLQRAYALLKDPALTIAEVAYRVGFKDPAHFSRSFSQHFGVAPSELRR